MPKPPPALTNRRRQVLAGTARGFTRKEIARHLNVSVSTVHEDLRVAARILHASRNTRAGIVGRAYATGALQGLPPERRPMVCVAPMQRLVLKAIAHGHTNAEIGARLYISPETVRTHVQHLLAKFDAKDRAHLVALAIQAGHVRISDLAREVAA